MSHMYSPQLLAFSISRLRLWRRLAGLTILFTSSCRIMETLLRLCLPLFIAANARANGQMDIFLGDLIDAWKLRSPTVVVQGELPEICMRPPWVLCLSADGSDMTELANHLSLAHQQGRQDGIIFVGRTGYDELLREIAKTSPSLLTSDNPVFLPSSHRNEIKLRLDSNIILFHEYPAGDWDLLDIFSVHDEPPITLELGKWNRNDGIVLQTSMNRWDRRKDLNGATLNNVMIHVEGISELITDKNGNILGSKGYSQDLLFYVTDNLNVTLKILPYSVAPYMFPNGSWTGGMGLLQRREADVMSYLAINLQRSLSMDFSLETFRDPITLHYVTPEGSAPNMWVYLLVFGPLQWAVWASMLVILVIGMYLITALSRRDSGGDLDSVVSGFVMVGLYTMQMGDAPDAKSYAARPWMISVSLLSLLMFIYYTGDITAKMTSGPVIPIPIRTFEDVIFLDYRVVTYSAGAAYFLRTAKPGSGMNTVSNKYLEVVNPDKTMEENMRLIDNVLNRMANEKLLLYTTATAFSNGFRFTPTQKEIIPRLYALTMDDSVYWTAAFALQKDSEFLQLFNHHILRQYETGIIRRRRRIMNTDLFTNENYGMTEPQPLGTKNVMFCFICLAVGICLGIAIFLIELLRKGMAKKLKWAWPTSNGIGKKK